MHPLKQHPQRLSDKDFNYVFGMVPRICIDLIIQTDTGIVLIKRAIRPYMYCWHLPGGTLFKGELFSQAVKRIALSETGLNVKMHRVIGAMEFPREKRGTLVHTVSIVMSSIIVGGKLNHDKNACSINTFYIHNLPSKMVVAHRNFILEHW